MSKFENANRLLHEFKKGNYLNGNGVLDQVGERVARYGKHAVLVADHFYGNDKFINQIKDSLDKAGVKLLAELHGAKPNAPRKDVMRIVEEIAEADPDVLISFGGGSTIDATKAAEVIRSLGGTVDDYFGTGLVTKALAEKEKKLTPHVAIQTAASSAAHMTKYSNITDVKTGQKKLIVDDAIVPFQPVFDYLVTVDCPISLTLDGGLDGISHCLEVFFSKVGSPDYLRMEAIAVEAISLVLEYLPKVTVNSKDPEAREALGLATDLGGYSIMIGGTNGAHLTSFSLVDILSHGRACGLMNPYYTVFFAPAVEAPLKTVGNLYKKYGYTKADIDVLKGRELGMAVAKAMFAFEESIGFPYKLSDIPGFSDIYIKRALKAAKDPQLKMKLENMPVSMTSDMVDEYMEPILQAAKTGNLDLIKNLK